MRFYYVFLMLIFIFFQLSGQVHYPDFGQPLAGKLLLSGNYCEFRPNHFHAGADFRTGTIGKPLYAIADGYVCRIKVAGGGYGNAIYLRHNQGKGYISLYAHLNRYEQSIASWVKQFQEEIGKFSFDYELDSTVFPVKKGQIIGYSGNSGRSFGPHLHFEIRNLNDEPLNPQLFGYKIKDTRPPDISCIAVYPVGSSSRVNNKRYSSVFRVKNNKLSADIFVRGEIYFGIESFDRLNDLGSRNAVYETKLYVDGNLIYHSQFNRFSYLHNQDVNSMVDYKRLITVGRRIQRCYVEPNNELFHYVDVKNNGIITFSDDKYHSVRFIVSDIYKNSTVISFRVKSNLYSKKSEKKSDSTYFFAYDAVNMFKKPGIEVFFPRKSLFDNIFFKFMTTKGTFYSPMYHIHNEYVPLKSSYILSLSLSLVPDDLKEKAVVCYFKHNKKLACLTGEIVDGYLSVYARSFGRFFLSVDTSPPTVIETNIRKGQNIGSIRTLGFKVTDDLSGIKDWAGFLNEQLVIVRYDEKNNVMRYNIDNKAVKGKNTFTLLITDGVGNIKEFRTSFFK